MTENTINIIFRIIQIICLMGVSLLFGFGKGSSHELEKVKKLEDEPISRGYAQLVIINRNETEFQWIDKEEHIIEAYKEKE